MSLSRPELRVDWCSYEAAKYAVMHWHYSRTMPVGKVARLGVWEADAFIGAVVFSCGSAGATNFASLQLRREESAELGRVALTEHENAVTRIVSIALRRLKDLNPGLRLIVSYADPEQGHLGAIYQAGNWTYVGRSSKDTAYIDKSGKRWHSRSVSESGWKVHCGKRTRCPRPSQMRAVEVVPKHKYLYPLDRAMRRQIAPLAKPYPKRASEAKETTRRVTNAETGGASPTRTL